MGPIVICAGVKLVRVGDVLTVAISVVVGLVPQHLITGTSLVKLNTVGCCVVSQTKTTVVLSKHVIIIFIAQASLGQLDTLTFVQDTSSEVLFEKYAH